VLAEVVLLAQHDLRAAPGEVARDADAVDAAADHEDVARVCAAPAQAVQIAHRFGTAQTMISSGNADGGDAAVVPAPSSSFLFVYVFLVSF
jgi:hypothetical protein